jgi:anti-anti-sigma factor
MSFPEQVNVFNAGLIREQMLAVINRGAAVLIGDMTDTLSCDNAGAEAIAHVYQRTLASGTDLRLVVSSETVQRTLATDGVDRVVSLYPFVSASLAAANPGTGVGERRMAGLRGGERR